jgi:hypothetical protein
MDDFVRHDLAAEPLKTKNQPYVANAPSPEAANRH